MLFFELIKFLDSLTEHLGQKRFFLFVGDGGLVAENTPMRASGMGDEDGNDKRFLSCLHLT